MSPPEDSEVRAQAKVDELIARDEAVRAVVAVLRHRHRPWCRIVRCLEHLMRANGIDPNF